jgi:hypothetical protein
VLRVGLDGDISVDMGQCRQSCSAKRTKINRKEFEAILKANYSVDPVEVYKELSFSRNFCLFIIVFYSLFEN